MDLGNDLDNVRQNQKGADMSLEVTDPVSGDVFLLGVTKFPDRKLPSLFLQRGVNLTVLASFSSEKNASLFYDALHAIAKAAKGKPNANLQTPDPNPKVPAG